MFKSIRSQIGTVTAVLALCCMGDVHAQLGDAWTITINGQSVQVNPDGSFRLRNIAAADLFGPGGPGTGPDFLSDDFLRVTGVGTVDGATQYAFSDPFQIRQNETFVIGDLTVTPNPPPLPESIRVVAAAGVLEVGQTSQLSVTGRLLDGSQIDVTPRTSWTTYRTSNPAVATVGPDGLVTANGLGTATITASNEGTTATTTIRVTSDIITTTVEGFVQDANRSGVSGVSMTASRFAGEALTGPDGFFSLTLSQIPVETTSLTVQGYATLGGQPYFGAAASLPIVPDGITDAGIIQICPQVETRWAEGFGPPGTDGHVYAMTIFDDGSGPALYVGGTMNTAGGITVNGIAKWNGSSWSAVGGGVSGSLRQVKALVVFDDGAGPALYAGGSFTTAGGIGANYIAKWNGSSWSALGGGMNQAVNALTVFDDGSGPALYAGGGFTTAGGTTANYVAKWNGTSWSALGNGMNNGVYALSVFDSGAGPALYAGGFFTTAGGTSASRVARWNGTSWSALGNGMNNAVYALSVFDSGAGPALYAGGEFTTAGGISANRIAKWNDSSWSALGTGINGTRVYALSVFDDGTGPVLCAGGVFTAAGGISARNIARWNGSSWFSLGSGMADSLPGVLALASFDDGSGRELYAGGSFGTLADGAVVGSIAQWNGILWGALLPGLNGSPRAITVFDDGSGSSLYVGGDFNSASGLLVNKIAKWSGSSWLPLLTGLNNNVSALVVFDDDGTGPNPPALYAGGGFIMAGTVPANYIAKWNGVSWSALATGMNNEVRALTVFDDGTGPALYAGGFFTTAGGITANYIARWNGNSWSSLGIGMNGPVYALAGFDEDGAGPTPPKLFAGGAFTTAGGQSASRIAKWTGSAWSPVGSGVSNSPFLAYIYCLAVFDDGNGPALFVGGTFTAAGGFPANSIARWNGASWSALGSGVTQSGGLGSVNALAVFDDGRESALYAGGGFTTAGGISANCTAKWDGSSWSALGTGMTNGVFAMHSFDDGSGRALWMGGGFAIAGGFPSYRIAKWYRPNTCRP